MHVENWLPTVMNDQVWIQKSNEIQKGKWNVYNKEAFIRFVVDSLGLNFVSLFPLTESFLSFVHLPQSVYEDTIWGVYWLKSCISANLPIARSICHYSQLYSCYSATACMQLLFICSLTAVHVCMTARQNVNQSRPTDRMMQTASASPISPTWLLQLDLSHLTGRDCDCTRYIWRN